MKITSRVIKWIKRLELYIDRPWYPALLAFLTFIDLFVVIIPSDGIIIASTSARPRKWFVFALAMSLGSLVGACVLVLITHQYGEIFINWIAPTLLDSSSWLKTENFFNHWGNWAIFAISVSPIAQQPILMLAGLSDMPLKSIAAFVFLGRFIKFISYSWISSHLPKLLKKIPGIKSELSTLNRSDPKNSNSDHSTD